MNEICDSAKAPNRPKVKIEATDDSVKVTVEGGDEPEVFEYSYPGIITGCELRDILAACGIHADYEYEEE